MRRRELSLLVLLLLAAGPLAAKQEARTKELSSAGQHSVMLAQNYLEGDRLEAAEKQAREALLSDPQSPLSHVTMGMVKAAQKQDKSAEGEFNRALALAPNDGAVLNAYGAWLCARGDTAGADAAFQRALQDGNYDMPVQPLANGGRCAFEAKDWPKADGYLRRALVAAPRSRPIMLMLAEVQLRLGRPIEARPFVQRSDALGPDPGTLALAARIEDAAGDSAAAEIYRKRLNDEFPNYVPTGEGARQP